MKSIFIDYKNECCELCLIGKKYGTDKSSQNRNADDLTDTKYCHPYTLHYHELFKEKRYDNLNICEIGILGGSGLRMLQEYFPNSNLYGFEYHNTFIDDFKKNFDNTRIKLFSMNVHDEINILQSLRTAGEMYDIIIEDTTHLIDDQIRVIKNIHPFLKKDGILIIEDIFLSNNENEYKEKLGNVLDNFKEYYFITLDHVNKNSIGWNNDKLLILKK
jgi:predicted O-methyltransferase YrrM